MTEEDLERKLRDEGFREVYIWKDDPNTLYPHHRHAFTAAHIVLEGDMLITIEDTTHRLGPGDRYDVAAGVLHAAKVGPHGCRYIIGEK